MAIQGKPPVSNNVPPAQTTMGQAFQGAAPQQPQQPLPNQGNQQQRNQPTFSFLNLNQMGNAPMAPTATSEVLKKLERAMKEVYLGMKPMYEVTLIPVDWENDPKLTVSVLIVALRDTTTGGKDVAFHTLILADSVTAMAEQYEIVNGKNVEKLITIGDSYNDIMISVVRDIVASNFAQSTLVSADACVVPRGFDVTNANAVYALAANAAAACSTELEPLSGRFVDMNLTDAAKDSTLVVKTSFNKTQLLDAVSEPNRADIVIDLSAAPANQANNQRLVDRVSPIARVACFIDLRYDPVNPVLNQFNQFQQQQQQQNLSVRTYSARVVMTQLRTVAVRTIPAQLLAIIPAFALLENNAWMHAFKPGPFQQKKIDIYDIGAIGLEVNFSNQPGGAGRIDTHADTFKDYSLGQMLTAAVNPNLAFSLDVPEVSDSSWHNGVFAYAANGNAAANQAILDACNTLTGGYFYQNFPQNGRVAVDENNRIHMGFYTDENGVKRDLRDAGYLAVLNMTGDHGLETIRDFSDTFEFADHDLLPRLAQRLKIIKDIFGNVEVTGFARRVTFEAQFMIALALSCKQAGLDIRATSNYSDSASYERATAAFASSTLMPAGPTQLFNRNTMPQASNVSRGNSYGHNRF